MSQKTKVAPPSPEEKAYLASQQALAAKQLEVLTTTSDFQKSYLESVKPLLDQQAAQASDPVQQEINKRTTAYQLSQLQQQEALAPLQDQVARKQLEDTLRGTNASPEQAALIDEATSGALQSGQSDISQFSQDSLRQLRENLAPSLGLRSTDTPILDRGALVQQEAARQAGKLVSDLRTANANAKLNYPLAATQLSAATGQAQQGLALSAQQFQSQLADAAVQNRMQLLGTGMNTGIGLAGASRPNQLSFQRGTSKSDSSSILGGAGGLLQGVGSIPGLGGLITGGLSAIGSGLGSVFGFLSDGRTKDDVKTIAHDEKGRRWVSFKYKGDPQNLTRMGVIAQEVEKTDPEAVLTNGLGLKFVNYEKLRAGRC